MALSVMLVAGLWYLTDRTIRATLENAAIEAVDVDMAGLVDIYASGGIGELERRIADRLALTPADGGQPHYLLARPDGRRIAGDLANWPALDPAVSESGEIPIGSGSTAHARATRLGPDLDLVVAHEPRDAGMLLRQVGIGFLLGGSLCVVIFALLGHLAAARLKRRIERVNSAFRDSERIAGDTLSHDDEIDELARHSLAALDRLRSLMEAYRDTSNQIAHEIRTPLMHLDSRLVKALDDGPDPVIAEKLVAARGEIKRIVATLESLLDIAASKARRGDRIGLAPVDLSALVERICDLYADSAEESGRTFVWRIEPDIAIEGEEAQLGRLVANLLDNAFKYVPEGGTVELELAAGPVLIVRDDGPGIAPEDEERIFERFYRGTGAKAELPGSGLGLALARAIAERHGMRLELEGTDGGAAFRLSGGLG